MTESQSDLVDFIEEMAVHSGYIYGIEYTHARARAHTCTSTHDIEIHAYTDTRTVIQNTRLHTQV